MDLPLSRSTLGASVGDLIRIVLSQVAMTLNDGSHEVLGVNLPGASFDSRRQPKRSLRIVLSSSCVRSSF